MVSSTREREPDPSAPARVRARAETGPEPRSAVRRELLRAVYDLASAPFRAVPYLLRRGALERALRHDLDHPRPVAPGPGSIRLPDEDLSIFVSAAEHSGEVHAANLVRALRRACAEAGAPEPRFHGLGGERLAAEGVNMLDDPIAHAAMGADVLGALPYYLGLLERSAAFLRRERPQLFCPVDSPALHVPMAHIARRYGTGVVHYVTPQYWAWAPWRVRGYKRAVDLSLTILPFEPAWFERHGVAATHVGHPQVDELAERFGEREPRSGEEAAKRLVLLPGSRRDVIRRNLPWMLRCVNRIRQAHPDLEVVLAHDDAGHEELLREILREGGAEALVSLELGDLHGALARARAALSVSGTILLDLLHHRLPSAVVYRIDSRVSAALSGRFLSVPWFSSVNLLAGREVLPESCFAGDGPLERMSSFLSRALEDRAFRAQLRGELELAAERLGPPGAPDRAARHILDFQAGRSKRAGEIHE